MVLDGIIIGIMGIIKNSIGTVINLLDWQIKCPGKIGKFGINNRNIIRLFLLPKGDGLNLGFIRIAVNKVRKRRKKIRINLLLVHQVHILLKVQKLNFPQ